jgi:hypothetical protein
MDRVALDIFFSFKKAIILDLVINVFPPLEPKLLILYERIGQSTENST